MTNQSTLHSARVSHPSMTTAVLILPTPPAFRTVSISRPSRLYRMFAHAFSLRYTVRTTTQGRTVAVDYAGSRPVRAQKYLPANDGATNPLALPFPWRTIPLPS